MILPITPGTLVKTSYELLVLRKVPYSRTPSDECAMMYRNDIGVVIAVANLANNFVEICIACNSGIGWNGARFFNRIDT